MNAKLPLASATWPLSSGAVVRVRLAHLKGHPVLECGVWHENALSATRPGRGSILLPLTLLPGLANGFAEALKQAGALDLLATSPA